MAIINIDDVGKWGIISASDMSPRHLPLGAWTYAKNVRFAGDHIEAASVLMQVWNVDGGIFAPGFAVKHLFSVRRPEGFQHLVMCGEDDVYASYGAAATDDLITGASAPYNANEWNGGVFNDILVINPLGDVTNNIYGTTNPQFWATTDPSVDLADLTNWPANTKCRVIRPFKTFLVALGVKKVSTTHPRMVKWSHSADVGIPSSWDHTNPALDAGENNLPYGATPIVDGLDLGEVFVIYTEDETWMMYLSNEGDIFKFRRMFPESGLLGQDCAVNIKDFPGKHFAVTQNDIILHDLYNQQSVIDKRLRKWFFSTALNYTKAYLVRVAVDHTNKEVWVGYVTGADTTIKHALVWNYLKDTWSDRALPSCRAVLSSPVEPYLFERGLRKNSIILGTETTPYSYHTNAPIFTAHSVDAEFHREDLCVVAGPNGQPVIDPYGKKLVRAIWPKFKSAGSSALAIYLDARDHESATWVNTGTGVYDPSTSEKVDLYAQGRFFRIRMVVTNNTSPWELQGYGLDVEPLGAR